MDHQLKLSDTDVSHLLDLLNKAGDAILEIYNDPTRADQWETKGDDSPLTLADKASNDVICPALSRLFPDVPIISEENKTLPYETRRGYTQCWLVDPLDGTKEFIKRNGEFTVNIALIENGRPVAGFVGLPVGGTRYFSVQGQGAWKVEPDGARTPLCPMPWSAEDKGLKVVASRSHMNQETTDYLAQFDEPSTVSKGSSLKFLLVAEGQAHLYPRIAPTMEWDTAAAHAILLEAGCTVNVFPGGEPLLYNKENLLNPYFVASAPQRVSA